MNVDAQLTFSIKKFMYVCMYLLCVFNMCVWGDECQAHMSEDDFVECILSFIFTWATE